MYNSGLTLEQIAVQVGLTKERIRQIVNPVVKYHCSIHRRTYRGRCEWCMVEQHYPAYLEGLTDEQLVIEGEKLGKKGRKQHLMLKRMYLVKYLRNIKGLKFIQIARMIKRAPSTVSFLFCKKS